MLCRCGGKELAGMLGIWTFMLWCFGVSQESHHLVGGELLGLTPKTPLNTLIGTGALWVRGH